MLLDGMGSVATLTGWCGFCRSADSCLLIRYLARCRGLQCCNGRIDSSNSSRSPRIGVRIEQRTDHVSVDSLRQGSWRQRARVYVAHHHQHAVHLAAHDHIVERCHRRGVEDDNIDGRQKCLSKLACVLNRATQPDWEEDSPEDHASKSGHLGLLQQTVNRGAHFQQGGGESDVVMQPKRLRCNLRAVEVGVHQKNTLAGLCKRSAQVADGQ